MSLSLVLPCYNVMKYLPKCLDSIFKNDCSDIEIVLVNDGSSDDIGGASMFNAMCFSRAQKIRTLNKGFYCYTIRPSGAFMKKRDAELVENKTALLKARSNIVSDLNKRGFNFSVKDYAGSNVMSCFELIIKMPFSARRETKKYISNLLVKESIKILPFTGRKKVDIPLLALKCNLQALMIYAVNLGKLFGVQFQL